MTLYFQRQMKQLMVLVSLTLLTACGTFQVGIEPGTTVVPETPAEATLIVPATVEIQEVTPSPTDRPGRPEPTQAQTPIATEEVESQQPPEQTDPSPLWWLTGMRNMDMVWLYRAIG